MQDNKHGTMPRGLSLPTLPKEAHQARPTQCVHYLMELPNGESAGVTEENLSAFLEKYGTSAEKTETR